MTYKKNITLEYFQTFFRSLNVTQGIWLVFLYFQGFSIFEIALFEVIFHITSLLMEIPTGVVADLLGRKTSRIIGVLSYFVYIAIILNSTNFAIVAIGFVFCSLSYVFESGAAEALIYDSLVDMKQEDTFMKVAGIKDAIFQIAGLFALFFTGLIYTYDKAYPFYLTGFFFIIAMIIIFLMKEVETERDLTELSFKHQMKKQFVISTKTVLHHKRLFLLIIIGGMMTAPVTVIFFFLQNYFDLNGIPHSVLTMYLALHALAAALGGFLAHKIEKRYGERKVLFVIPFFMVLSFWLLNIPNFLLYPFIFLGFLESIFYIVILDYMNKITPSDERATVNSFFGLAFSFVMIFVFGLVGLIIELGSFELSFFVLASIVTIFFILLLTIIRHKNFKA